MSAIGLGGESSRSHAEEAEEPVNHIEQHASHGDGSDIGSRSQMAYNADVNQSQQGNGDVGNDGGQGNVQNLSVGRLHKMYSTSLNK